MAGLGTDIEAAKFFFFDLSKDMAEYYESIMTASPVLHMVLENDAYSVLPCVYLMAENNLAQCGLR
jgi:hypothetical protein